MIFIGISVVVLVLSFFAFDHAAGIANPRKMNMMGVVFFFTFLAQAWVAGILVVNSVDDHYMLARLVHQDARLAGWMAINYAMLTFPLGMVLANIAWTGQTGAKQRYQQFLDTPTRPAFTDRDDELEMLLVLGFVVVVAATVYTLKTIGFVGIYELLFHTGAEEELRVMRNEAKWGFGGVVYVRNFFMSLLGPLLASFAFAHYLRRRTLFSMAVFLGYLVVCVVALTYSFEKAPLLYFIFSLGFVYLYHRGGMSWRVAIFCVALVAALLVAMYTLLSMTAVTIGYNTGPIGRILLSQSVGTFLSFDYFGRIGDFVGLTSVSRLFSDLFGLEYSARSARLLMEFYNPAGIRDGTSGVISSLFVAEAWANFGLLGVIVAPVYVAFLLQSLFIFLISVRKTVATVALFGYFSFGSTLGGGLNAYYYDPGMVILVCVLGSGWVFVKFLAAASRRTECA